MKAIVCTRRGSPKWLKLREVEKPMPADNELLVKIHATTVTVGDVMLRKMFFPIYLLFKGKKNQILGHEFAGVVKEIGKDVKSFKKGDKVFATVGFDSGTYSEYRCLAEDKVIALMPSNMSFAEAAAVPVGGITTVSILRKGNIQKGDKVLIYGASGSLGTYAVQLAKHYGAEVTGVCSTKNLELVKSLGADKVIDYTKGDFTKSDEKYDVIFEAIRKVSSKKLKMMLNDGGTLLSSWSEIEEKKEDLLFLKELIEAGKMKAVIDRSYPLEQIQEAHAYVDKGHKVGNVSIIVHQE